MAPSLVERLRRFIVAYEQRQQQQHSQAQQQQAKPAAAVAASAAAAPPSSLPATKAGHATTISLTARAGATTDAPLPRWLRDATASSTDCYSSAQAHPHARHLRTRSLEELAAPRPPLLLPTTAANNN